MQLQEIPGTNIESGCTAKADKINLGYIQYYLGKNIRRTFSYRLGIPEEEFLSHHGI